VVGLREIEAGSEFGDYTIVSEVGSGSEGVVFLADDKRLGHLVALKLVDELEFPYLDEALRVTELNDECICPVYETGRLHGLGFISMGVVDGDHMRDLLESHERRREPEFWLHILRHVGEALADAHDHGLGHGSLRLTSVFLRHSGSPVVLDFGMRGEGFETEELEAVDIMCFARLLRRCLEICPSASIPPWLKKTRDRALGNGEAEPFESMRDFVLALSEPSETEEEDSLSQFGSFCSEHKKQIQVGVGVTLALVCMVFLMGVGSIWDLGGSGRPSPRPPKKSGPHELTEEDIQSLEKGMAVLKEKPDWEHVQRAPAKLSELSEQEVDIRQQILKAPQEEGLRFRLAKLQVEAAELLSKQGDLKRAKRYLSEARSLLGKLPRTPPLDPKTGKPPIDPQTKQPRALQYRWEEIARYEGHTQLLEGQMLEQQGAARAAQRAYSRGLRQFHGRKLEPEAEELRKKLAERLRAMRLSKQDD
jgi:hypothetical protein